MQQIQRTKLTKIIKRNNTKDNYNVQIKLVKKPQQNKSQIKKRSKIH